MVLQERFVWKKIHLVEQFGIIPPPPPQKKIKKIKKQVVKTRCSIENPSTAARFRVELWSFVWLYRCLGQMRADLEPALTKMGKWYDGVGWLRATLSQVSISCLGLWNPGVERYLFVICEIIHSFVWTFSTTVGFCTRLAGCFLFLWGWMRGGAPVTIVSLLN